MMAVASRANTVAKLSTQLVEHGEEATEDLDNGEEATEDLDNGEEATEDLDNGEEATEEQSIDKLADEPAEPEQKTDEPEEDEDVDIEAVDYEAMDDKDVDDETKDDVQSAVDDAKPKAWWPSRRRRSVARRRVYIAPVVRVTAARRRYRYRYTARSGYVFRRGKFTNRYARHPGKRVPSFSRH